MSKTLSATVQLGTDLVINPPTLALKYRTIAANDGRHYDVSKNGKRFLVIKDAPSPNGEGVDAPINIILNWADDLKPRGSSK
jgi:hypothetical protein